MISISEKANKNYLAKIVQLKNVQKHPNADRLQTVTIDFQNVITGLDAKDGDVYVYFPVESQINLDFLSATNSFRHTNLNKVQDDNKPGFFEDNGRVKAMKLRGEKSMGYIVPVAVVESFTGKKLTEYVGQEFDTIGDVLMLKKYLVPSRGGLGTMNRGKKPKVSRIIDSQVRLHVDTENFRKEAYKIKPEDHITISYKYHGTSFWVSNVLVKKNLKIYEKILKFLGVNIVDTEYDYVYGSRKVVKNADMDDAKRKDHFYKYDLWGEVKEEIKEFVPKGFTIYGEIVGFLKGGKAIQGEYDYNCAPEEKKVLVYRITFTNADGIAMELSSAQIKEYCDYFGLNYVHVFYSGKACDLYSGLDQNLHWHEDFVKNLEKDYNDKDCFISVNKIPEEGIVIRKEKLFSFEAYKLKSFRFLEYETNLLDQGFEDIENFNGEIDENHGVIIGRIDENGNTITQVLKK